MTTEYGKQTIGTLQVGQKVWAYNPKAHKMELEAVLHVWINHDNDLVDLTLTTTTTAQQGKAATQTSETIHTNKKHPFLTQEKGFLTVGQIALGMHVLRADGTYGVVTGWKVVSGTQVMYDLEVAQDHTFTVGAEQWIVHNCGGSSLFDQLSNAGKETDRGGLTKAGRAFQKHASRSDLWGRIQGDANVLNQTGQDVLDDIITHPSTTWESRSTGRFGPVLEARLPDGRGARWGLDATSLETTVIEFLKS